MPSLSLRKKIYVVLIKNGVFMITSGITKASTQVTGVTQIESENELPHG